MIAVSVTNIYSFTLAMFILFFLYLKDNDLNYGLAHILHDENARKVSLQFLTGMDVHNHRQFLLKLFSAH